MTGFVTLDQSQAARRVGDWIVTDDECVRRFEIQDESIWKAYSVVKIYCYGRKLPMFVFGLDLTNSKSMAAQEGMLTRALTRMRKDSALDEVNRDLLVNYVRWHRGLYRWWIDGDIQKAVAELESVGAKKVGQEPLGGANG